MKKIMLVVLCAMMCIYGCANGTSQVKDGAEELAKVDYTGLWEHTENPDVYSVIVYEQTEDSIGFVATAMRMGANGIPAQIATVRQENVKLGDTQFKFMDSFGNSGVCDLKVTADELTFNFNVDGERQGNWCIDAGNGSYKKTQELSELEWFDKDDYELGDYDIIR